MAQVLETIERIKELIFSDEIVTAYEMLEELMAQEGIDRDFVMEVPEIALLYQDMEMAGSCMELLTDLESWTPVHQDNAIATFCKGTGNEFFVRAELQMHQPLFPLFALFSEVDLFTEW